MKIPYPLFVLGIIFLSFVACKKDNENNCRSVEYVASQTEVVELKNYLEDNAIEAEYDERGFYYIILKEGTGKTPHQCSKIKIDYEGKLTNNHVFDAANAISFPLENLIMGWRMGLPLLKEGGEMILYLPPSLAYGARAQGDIPANSILIFKINLIEVQN
ncbi:MAG TPA: FKBP-type peptidyl-prolyl cis-trans isomerase [Chitinophagaceae bacterium]|nr:FKBP-type peptidyl-prolyl cis-trans isomerase [Chitinophagaceae bacterium]